MVLVSFASSLALAVSGFGCASAEDIALGYLYIQSGSSWVVESFNQFKLAVKDVNDDPTILKYTNLTYLVENSQGSETEALQGAINHINNGVVGVVGTGYSTALSASGMYCTVMQKPIVSPGSTWVNLINKVRYPYMMRSIASDLADLKAMAVAIHDLGWRRVAILHTDIFGAGIDLLIRPAFDSMGIQSLTFALKQSDSPDFETSTDMVLSLVRQSGYRVCLLYSTSDGTAYVEASSRTFGLREAGYYWVLWSGLYTDLAAEWGEMGATVVFPMERPNDAPNLVANAFHARWPNVSTIYNLTLHGEYNSSSGAPFFDVANADTIWDTDYAPLGDGVADYWGTFVYDTVWLYARAIQAVKDSGGDPNRGAALREALRDQNFQGITGQVVFDKGSQDRTKDISFYKADGPSKVLIGHALPAMTETSPGAAADGWCSTGCSTLNTTSLTGESTGVTDGSSLDVSKSFIDVEFDDFRENSTIRVIAHVRDSFNQVPCRTACGNASSAACSACVGELAMYGALQIHYHEVQEGGENGDARRLVSLIPDGTHIDYQAGAMTATFDYLPGGGNEDRKVALQVLFDGHVIGSDTFTLQSLACQVGQYADVSECIACAPGRFSDDRGLTECDPCSPGKTQGLPGSSECDTCEVGKFAGDGFEECAVCPEGQYQDEKGQSSCKSCRNLIAGSTTKLLGAVANTSCICPQEYWYSKSAPGAAAECRECPEGLLCDTYSNDPPKQAAGFHAGPQAFEGSLPEFTVVCARIGNCPAGRALDSCREPREGLACDHCPVGSYDDAEGSCVECSTGTSLAPLLIFAIAACLFMFLLSMYVTRSFSIRNTALLTVALSGSLMVTAFQTLAVFHQLSITWIEPMASVRAVILLLTFEVDFLNLECFFQSNSVVLKYLFSLFVYPLFALILLALLGTEKALGRQVTSDQVWNAQGNVMMIIYPSLAMMALMPLRCTSNPDESSSMIMGRSILCWEGEHNAMVVLGCIAVFIYIIAFISYVAYAVRVYPVRMARDGAAFVRQYAFLFRRFRADRYYYALVFVIRNVSMALVPVVFADSPAMQVLAMAFLLFVLFGAVCYLLPWCSKTANLLDCFVTICLLLLLTIGIIHSPMETESVEVTMQVIMTILLVGMFGLGFIVIKVHIYRYLFPAKKYGIFLSHHKGGAQLLARWFKQMLTDRMYDGVFLDSDNLDELSSLIQTVASETKNLVILLTQETLCRLWCGCEIISATQNGTNIVLVSCDGTEAPDDERIEQLEEIWTEPQLAEFASLGVGLGDITEAYRCLRDKPILYLANSSALGDEIVEQIITNCRSLSVVGAKRKALAKSLRFNGSPLQKPMPPELPSAMGADSEPDESAKTQVMDVLLVGKASEMESACCLQVVRRLLAVETQKAIQVGQENILQHQLGNTDRMVALLRRGVLSDAAFAAAAVYAMREGMEVLLLLADEGFLFPNQEFWAKLESGGVISVQDHPLLAGASVQDVMDAYKAMFKIIAVKFTEHGSESIQGAEISALAKRLKGPRGRGLGSRSPVMVATPSIGATRGRTPKAERLQITSCHSVME